MAGQPFDYRIQVQNPFEAATQGLMLGANIELIRQNQQSQALAMQKEQAELERQKMMQQEVNGFLSNPTAEGVLRLSAMMPAEQAKSVREGWAALGEDKANKSLSQVTQIASALLSDTPKVGIDMLNEAAAGARNAENEQLAVQYETYAKTAEQNPRFAALTALVPTTGTEAGRKALESLIGVQKAPAEIKTGEAGATKTETEAKYAEQVILRDLELKGWNTAKIKNDIALSREDQRLRAMEARTARMNAGLERDKLMLQIENARTEYNNKVADRVAQAEGEVSSIDNILFTAESILNHPRLSSALGPIESRIPTLSEETADAEALIETLGSQSFLSQAQQMRGMGALTENEGKKLMASIANLKQNQSESQFRANVKTIIELTKKAREKTVRKYGMPSTAPSAMPQPDSIDALVKKYLPGGQ